MLQPIRLLQFFASCLFLGNEKTLQASERASEMIFYFVFFFSFCFSLWSQKEGSSRIRKRATTTTASFSFCLGLVFMKGRAKIRIMIEGKERKSQ
jgi:hypothetical protein